MEDTRELSRKDLAIILKLDAQIDYSQKRIVEKYYEQIIQKGLLTTAVGQRYRNKLEQIINGDTYHKCLFCMGETSGNTVICPACMAKFRPSAAVYCRSCGNKMNVNDTVCPSCGKDKDEGYKYCAHCGSKVPMPNMKSLTNDVKNKSRDFAGYAAEFAKENVQNIAKQGEKLAGDISIDAKVANTVKEGKNVNKRNVIAAIVILLIAIGIVGTIGLESVFGFFTLASLGFLIYRSVKKKPKRNAVIAFVVFLLLTGIAGMNGANGMGDDVLDYIGTKESVVYQTYDKAGFVPILNFLSNESTNKSGLPHIGLNDSNPRIVWNVILESGMNASFHAGGLHIGDDMEQVRRCMDKLKATENSDYSFLMEDSNGELSGTLQYTFRYKGKDMSIIVYVTRGLVSRISVSSS